MMLKQILNLSGLMTATEVESFFDYLTWQKISAIDFLLDSRLWNRKSQIKYTLFEQNLLDISQENVRTLFIEPDRVKKVVQKAITELQVHQNEDAQKQRQQNKHEAEQLLQPEKWALQHSENWKKRHNTPLSLRSARDPLAKKKIQDELDYFQRILKKKDSA